LPGGQIAEEKYDQKDNDGVCDGGAQGLSSSDQGGSRNSGHDQQRRANHCHRRRYPIALLEEFGHRAGTANTVGRVTQGIGTGNAADSRPRCAQ
jgi:hypothetical protein